MMISHSKKFIFIHNPKVAGTSIRRSLADYESKMKFHPNTFIMFPAYLFKYYPWVFSYDFPGHIRAYDLKSQIDQRIWESYFKFGMVRNPWSWHVSFFNFMQKDRPNKNFEFKSVEGMSFEEFTEWRCNNMKGNSPQKDMFFDPNGNKLVDTIYRYENVDEAFSNLCNRLSVKTSVLTHLNKSTIDEYEKYYTSKTKNLIGDLWSEDIEHFNYDF